MIAGYFPSHVMPSPLEGEGKEGGAFRRTALRTPHPSLPLKGGGAHYVRIESPPPPSRGREGWGGAAARC